MQLLPTASWHSPKTERGRISKLGGKGFFATQPISKGEIVFIKMGRIIDRQTLIDNEAVIQGSQEQITDDLYLAPLTDDELKLSMVYVNHSCEPNVGIQGQIIGVTLRDIEVGEELTLDYAMIYDDDYAAFTCNCGTVSCRRQVTGRDWRLPELQARYRGYFAWFIDRKLPPLTKENT